MRRAVIVIVSMGGSQKIAEDPRSNGGVGGVCMITCDVV